MDLLSTIIAQRAKVSLGSLDHRPELRDLVNYGLLRKSGVVSSVVCTECSDPHAAEVAFEEGEYGYFCPELGFLPLSRKEILGILPDLNLLVERLADAFACKRRKATPVHGQTWRIGAVTSDNGDVMLYFHPRLRDEDDARALANALAREVNSPWRLVITAEGRFPVAKTEIVALSELVELDPGDEQFVPVADPCALVGVPRAKKTGAPNRFGKQLIALIQARIESKQALTGRNEEAAAILPLFKREHPGIKPPSLSNVRAYVTKVRSG